MTPTPAPQQIIELAREAGFVLGFSSPALEKHMRFATLLLERFGQAPAEVRGPLTDAQIEAGRQRVFSTNNPFCPCDSKTMRKAVQWAERAHGITGSKT